MSKQKLTFRNVPSFEGKISRYVFHTIFGHITFDVAAIYEITQEEFIEMINRITIQRELSLFVRTQFWVLLWVIQRSKMY